MLGAGGQLSHSEGLITIGGAASCSSEKYPSASISKNTCTKSHFNFYLIFYQRHSGSSQCNQ